MSTVRTERMAAEIEGDFVVFLIGMRINKPWKVHKWLPVFLAMSRMLKELEANPSSGLIGYSQAGLTVIQYWRSFEQLEAYARSTDGQHWPAWVAFNKRSGRIRGDVGIWHETYRIRSGEYEAVYRGMPAHGLGKAGQLVSATGRRETARGRMYSSDESSGK